MFLYILIIIMTHDKCILFFCNLAQNKFRSCFLMIIVGGLTRLTDSGLSITEWELFKGIFPPFNEFE